MSHHIYVFAYSTYFTEENYVGPFKVGITQNIKSRLAQMQTSNPNSIETVWTSGAMDHEMAYASERFLHELLRKHRARGEWFNLEPRTLWHLIAFVENAVRQAGRMVA